MVLPASHKVSRASWYSGSVSWIFSFRLRGSHTLRRAFPSALTKIRFHFVDCPHPFVRRLRFGLFPVRSPLLRKSLFCFLFLRVLRCFSSPSSLPIAYLFSYGWLDITPAGFPHSDICGSMFACNSPQLIAAYHVLLRLLVPRHSPYALNNLTLLL